MWPVLCAVLYCTTDLITSHRSDIKHNKARNMNEYRYLSILSIGKGKTETILLLHNYTYAATAHDFILALIF